MLTIDRLEYLLEDSMKITSNDKSTPYSTKTASLFNKPADKNENPRQINVLCKLIISNKQDH